MPHIHIQTMKQVQEQRQELPFGRKRFKSNGDEHESKEEKAVLVTEESSRTSFGTSFSRTRTPVHGPTATTPPVATAPLMIPKEGEGSYPLPAYINTMRANSNPTTFASSWSASSKQRGPSSTRTTTDASSSAVLTESLIAPTSSSSNTNRHWSSNDTNKINETDILEESPEQEKMIVFLSGKPSSERPKYSKVYKFPMKLFYILECGEYNEIISWMEDGLTFQVLDEDLLVCDVLPTVFKEAKFSSFHRKLNRWKFQKLHKKEGSYTHSLFRRGRMDLCQKISIEDGEGMMAFSYQDILNLNFGPSRTNVNSFYHRSNKGNLTQASNNPSAFGMRAHLLQMSGGGPLMGNVRNNGDSTLRLGGGGQLQMRSKRPAEQMQDRHHYYHPYPSNVNSSDGARNTFPSSAHMTPFYHRGYEGGDRSSYIPEGSSYVQNRERMHTMSNPSMPVDYMTMYLNSTANPGQQHYPVNSPTMQPMTGINENTGEPPMSIMSRMEPRRRSTTQAYTTTASRNQQSFACAGSRGQYYTDTHMMNMP